VEETVLRDRSEKKSAVRGLSTGQGEGVLDATFKLRFFEIYECPHGQKRGIVVALLSTLENADIAWSRNQLQKADCVAE